MSALDKNGTDDAYNKILEFSTEYDKKIQEFIKAAMAGLAQSFVKVLQFLMKKIAEQNQELAVHRLLEQHLRDGTATEEVLADYAEKLVAVRAETAPGTSVTPQVAQPTT